MAKKEEKKVKKPAKVKEKAPEKVEKKEPVKEKEKAPAKAEKKSEPKRETKVIKAPEVAKKVKEKKPLKKKIKEAKFEDKKDLDKLYVYFTVVNSGVGDSVVKVFEEMGCSVSFVQNGTGTATEEVKKALHIQDSRKEVVISIIRESRLEDVEKELAAFFLAARRNKGIAFATKMDAIQGVRLYKFLSQTL